VSLLNHYEYSHSMYHCDCIVQRMRIAIKVMQLNAYVFNKRDVRRPVLEKKERGGVERGEF
jgi:hypothetical protein